MSKPLSAAQIAAKEHNRHLKACSDANPACRRHPNVPPEVDRPEDIAANEAARIFEKKYQW